MMNDNKSFEACNNVIDAQVYNKNVGITWLRILFSKRSIKDQFYILCTTPRFCHYKSILKNQIHFKVPFLHGKTFRATHMESMLVVSLQPIENLCNVDIFQPRGTNARLQHILKLAYYSLFSSLFLAEKSWI